MTYTPTYMLKNNLFPSYKWALINIHLNKIYSQWNRVTHTLSHLCSHTEKCSKHSPPPKIHSLPKKAHSLAHTTMIKISLTRLHTFRCLVCDFGCSLGEIWNWLPYTQSKERPQTCSHMCLFSWTCPRVHSHTHACSHYYIDTHIYNI